ncbi:quinone-dependent dihydroorotate dehydrogenase [Chondrinema litorale]|uniref:quinone-dependent dihydroorotate dehydrogenase n=1 Tax=Chondrinema litorale TaxID=2994555 RepID=UPI00254467AF|nr:quinone-dependent dihydroorotate dehydrogenase [Chondrinema litorale]UZR93234.1 quinone-dependent dihydroorotate dehydrogenase [Chondrinema litorale]
MYKVIRSFLFFFPPEQIHHFTFSCIKFLFKIPLVKPIYKAITQSNSPELQVEIDGLKFPNPVGLAAGFDKDARLIEELSALGFGFIEIGTVTPKGQPGNPQPRLFRVKADEGIINRMGFNNEGVESAVNRLKKVKDKSIVIGGNIGKNKITPNEKAEEDYLICYRSLYEYVDYFTVNVSSPNTPNLRELQDKEPLTKLLNLIQAENQKQIKPKPVFLKIAPDLADSQLDDIIEIVEETKISGIIATNTTISRANLITSKDTIDQIGNGGLSGKPLTARSTEVIKYLYEKSGKKLTIIGVGGIHSAKDAIEKLEAGACMVQLYTGFIYEGPGLIKKINKEVKKYKKNTNRLAG